MENVTYGERMCQKLQAEDIDARYPGEPLVVFERISACGFRHWGDNLYFTTRMRICCLTNGRWDYACYEEDDDDEDYEEISDYDRLSVT